MGNDPSMGRFFAYLNLFVASMLVLVLADNLLLLFAGWEGVGLCSYLLIGFWYERPETNYAANKAFITTRIGDVFFFARNSLPWLELETLDISTAIKNMGELWPVGSVSATFVALCLLAGAVGKSRKCRFIHGSRRHARTHSCKRAYSCGNYGYGRCIFNGSHGSAL